MAFSQMNEDIACISRLDDEPSESAGMSAAALKAEFDRAGLALQRYINETLLPELEAEGAAGSLGLAPVAGLGGAENVQQAVEALVRQLREASMGSVAPDSVDALRLTADSVTTEKIAAGAVTEEKLAPESVDTDSICSSAVTGDKLAPGSVTASKLDVWSVTGSSICPGAVGTYELGDLSVTGEKICSSAVTEAKLAPDAVSREYTGTLDKTQWRQQGELYTQSLSLPGLKADSRVMADMDASGVSDTELPELCSAWSLILKAGTGNGSVSFFAPDIPDTAIPVKLLEVRR